MSETGPGMIRAFLAANLPVATVRRIADEVASLQTAAAAAGLRVNWVPATNMHLTLKFLGQIKAASVEAIGDRLAREFAARAPFDVETRGMGAFPPAERPRVLWAGLVPSPPLLGLQKDLERAMEEIGFPREERAFHPHLTIGRVASGEGSLATALGEREARSFGGGRIHEVVLYESRTWRTGAEYHVLERIILGGK